MSDSVYFVTWLETLGMSFSMNDATSLLCHTAAATRLRQTPRSCWSPKISTSPVPTSQLQSCFRQYLSKLTHASPYTLPACVLAFESCLSVTSLCFFHQMSSMLYLSVAAGLDPRPSSLPYQHPFLHGGGQSLGLHLFLYQGSHISRFNSSLSSWRREGHLKLTVSSSNSQVHRHTHTLQRLLHVQLIARKGSLAVHTTTMTTHLFLPLLLA